MDSREIKQELHTLTAELGMDMDEALGTLGLQADDPLLEDAVNEAAHPAEHIVEMFPRVPRDKILRLYKEHNGNAAAVSDELLNLEAIAGDAESGTRGAKSSRKAQKASNRLARKQQQKLHTEETDIQFIADQTGLGLAEARQLYWTHSSDVTAALMAKMPKAPLVPVSFDGHGTSTVVSESGGVTVRTHRPAATAGVTAAAGPVSEVGEYAHMPYRELRAREHDIEARIRALTSVAWAPDRAKPHVAIRAQDASAELRRWRGELELVQLALNRPGWLRQTELPSRVLDLHGYSLEQAKIMAGDAVRKFRQSRQPELEIVTGAGRHSSQGRAVIKPWLREYLRTQHVRMRENEGSFVISQKPLV